MTREPNHGGFVHGIEVPAKSLLDGTSLDRDPDKLFGSFWRGATSDHHETLFGFRRYRTAHLLNLRFLEAEIEEIDRHLYQAGLQRDQCLDRRYRVDRLGLQRAKRDSEHVGQPVNKDLIARLRTLIKEYGRGLHGVYLGPV